MGLLEGWVEDFWVEVNPTPGEFVGGDTVKDRQPSSVVSHWEKHWIPQVAVRRELLLGSYSAFFAYHFAQPQLPTLSSP